MKLHLPYLLRRAVVRALFAAATVVTTLASTTYADMITPDGRTATQVIQSGSVYDVYTNTVRGNTGFNSFSTFDVYAETTANLHLADGTGRLINVVRDSASHIDGVLNSYKDGRIGGDVYFLNPNGIIVGKTGVVNVGSISMSTPTAAFVEQLIARDGSISPTATQAVLAGDMPINEKGTISIKGKVNARNTVEMRAGKVEVKGGEVNTGVKFREMVNTGKRKVDTKGMSIQGGKLSFGKKPSKARKVAKAKVQEQERKADIAIFADDVLLDGGNLNADWVYIDPDKLEFSNQAISGDYTLEARVIVLNNISVKEGEKLTSFTLNAANELADGTFEGNVSITLSDSNLVADRVDINASATTNAADAIISITGSTIKAEGPDSVLNINATSGSGNTSVDIQGSSLSGGSLGIAAVGVQGSANLMLGKDASATADTVALTAVTVTGDATVNVQGTVKGGNDVTIAASTGNVYSESAEDTPLSEMEFKAEGGGNATVTVDGTVEAKGALTVTAAAIGTYGDATLNINGKLSSLYTETKAVGELGLERTQDETVLETDTEEQVNAKNAKYLERYTRYLKTKETDTAATATIELAANASAGSAAITQAATSELQASLNTAINADAAKAASILLAGKTDSGNINAAAKGETATLRVAKTASLASHPHQSFSQDGTVISVSKNNGSISLEAKSRDESPNPLPVPEKKDGVLLEVAGTLTARRETKDGAGAGGAITLASDGKLTVTDNAVLDASSARGQGGTIAFNAPEYELQSPLGYKVNGTSGQGTINLMNHEGLTGDNINNADSISSDFIKNVLGLSQDSGSAPKEWTSDFIIVTLSGNIVLVKDVEASIHNAIIKDGTTITGNGHSLKLTNSILHYMSWQHVLDIGSNVTITGVENFTFEFTNNSLPGFLSGWYFFTPTSLSIGENFKVKASGNVTMSMEGYGNTYIEFGKGVNITAGGDVKIDAKNTLGWGGCLGNASPPTDVLASIVKVIPALEDSGVGKALSKLGVFKFDTSGFLIKIAKYIGEKKDDSQEALPQLGLRVSKASVTFADNSAGSIKGNTVTISSSSTADLSGTQVAGAGGMLPFALSLGILSNNSKVDLGKDLTITATGANKENVSVSITSTTESKLSLGNCFSSNTANYAGGLLVSVGRDVNEVNVDKSVTIQAEKDIKIAATSKIANHPFMSLGSGWEKKVEKDPTKEYAQEAPAANNLFMFGVDWMYHKNEVAINGNLTSSNGNIDVQSVCDIASSLTMKGGLQYTLAKAEEKKQPKELSFFEFLKKTFIQSFKLDLGIDKMKIDADTHKLVGLDDLRKIFGMGETLSQELVNQEEAVERSLALPIASDIVIANNSLVFNGNATATKGSVTLNAASSIEAACGAETSIVGLPAKQAVAGSISVPVVIGDTTVEIGSNANITAGNNISVSSSTSLPMSFDLLGWRDWAKFVTDAGGNRTPSQFLTALRGSLQYVSTYKDNGDFGILNSLTSSHASTLMKGTGKEGEDTMTMGGDLVVDVRNLNTRTVINDGAHLTAGGKLSATSAATGTQVTFAGQLPVYLALTRPNYVSTKKARSGFGGSVIVGEKTFNTVTYIGAATLAAGQLEVDATGDAFMMEMSLAGTFGSEDHGVQGGVNIIVENKMTVSEVSGDAQITLTNQGEVEGSSITATDKSVLLNISGMEADGGKTAVGVGVAVTVNNAFTAAMLGNNLPINSTYESNWKSVWGDSVMPFARAGAITLNLDTYSNLTVEAENKAAAINIGLSAAVQTGGSGDASVAANVGVAYSKTETTARQFGVTATGHSDNNDITTQSADTSTIVSVAGDASINTSGKNKVTGAGALSVNRGVMDTTAYVTNCDYGNIRDFHLDANNKATVVAVDVAAGVGAATAGIAAGSAWNSLSGNTGAYLTGGSVTANKVSITSLTDLTSFSCTLGAAIGINLNASGEGDDYEALINSSVASAQELYESERLENTIAKYLLVHASSESLGENPDLGESLPELADANDVSFDLGASISRNALDMSSQAIVEACTVTTPGELKVTAEDISVITAVSVGAAFTNGEGVSIGAGGVFSFAPVSSTTEAAIRQKKGKDTQLDIHAGSLTLHAKDNHRERLWSFGGGYGDTAGIGLVLSWGSFAGATTQALIENVNATIGTKADILSSSKLDSTYISVGASGSKGNAAVTGMVNYLNFNNQVITDIKDSTLTVTAEKGIFKALSEGTRTFTDGFGNLSVSGGKPGASVGGALSFIYVGGNGSDDTNQTQMLVSNSFINNSGTTELLANSSTTGLLAGANASAKIGGSGLSFTGSFAWISDASITRVDIHDTFFNQRNALNDKNANIKAEATSSSNLTAGIGSLSVQIGGKGAGIGVSIAVLKDNATTAATMHGGGVESAHDFTLHASGRADLAGLVIGGAGSDLVGVSGGALASSIIHHVTADLEESVMNMNGALTIKADNTTNVGRDAKTRFTVANAALGLEGAGIGVGVSIIDIADVVTAKAHNVSVDSGSMSVLAEENNGADAVTVNVAGGQYAAGSVDVVRPVLRSAANAFITADKETLADGPAVGITTTGDLALKSTNTQWVRSHLWTLALAVEPAASGAANICVNAINMAGSANALIQGAMPLTIGGDMNVTADCNRTASYTTVAVSGSLGFSLNVDVNSLRVSNDTASLTDKEKAQKGKAAQGVDKEIAAACKLIQDADIKLDDDTKLTVSDDVANAMSNAAKAADDISSQPKTLAKVDLGGKTAAVGGNACIMATDTITTTPTTVPVTGGLLAVAPHINITDIKSEVETIVNDAILSAGGDIAINAQQRHTDDFHAVGVAIAGVEGTGTEYKWTDNATTTISLTGTTNLKSAGGGVAIATDSDISETFFHVNTGVAIGKIAFILPSFRQTENNTLTIGNGVGIEAQKGIAIATNSTSSLDASTYDVTLSGGNLGFDFSEIVMSTTPTLAIGDNATITGGSVGILQNISRKIGIVEDHVTISIESLSFPFLTISDTVTATLTIGDGCTISATTGDLTIASNVNTQATLGFLGVNGLGFSLSVAKNEFTETVSNKVKLGKNVKLRAQNGTMTVHANNKHKGDMAGCNITANALNLTDVLTSYNHGAFTAEVSIGTGFNAAGRVLTLEALNTEEFLSNGKKVTVSLVLNPYSKNGIDVKDTSTATITLEGGMIDVAQFNAEALTDVAVKASQLLGGRSLTVDINFGEVASNITQTSNVTLGTEGNSLDILTDDVSITAHNRHTFKRLENDTPSMVYGDDLSILSSTSKGTVKAQQNLNAMVTLGGGSKIRRRADAAHYLTKDEHTALVSATNNVDSDTEISLTAASLLNANCILTTWDQTTASATLNLNGSIDTWGDTELTAYSHARHNMINSVTSGSIFPTFHTHLKNTIDTNDAVNISGAVESIGNITIQSGSAKGKYKLVDGTTVLAGDDDTNATHYFWGKDEAVIYNKRRESVTINADVRAGGELSIYNDSAANTVKQPFHQTHESDDFRNAAIDTAADVTSSITIGGDAKLYAGLGSAIQMAFQGSGSNLNMQFRSAQKIFDESEQLADGTWLAPKSVLTTLSKIYRLPEDTKNRLGVSALTLPGMAFRVESKADLAVFAGKLYSPAKHGLDIFIAPSWDGHVETTGVTLRGYETGLFFNRQAVEGAVSACAAPDLYRSEGVSIRSQAQGHLYLSGIYDFPYSTLQATSEHNLIVTGDLRCGSVLMNAGEDFILDTPDKDQSLQGALQLYTGLFNKWESTAQQNVKNHAASVVAGSGNGGKDTNTGCYKAENYHKTFTAEEVRQAAESGRSRDGGIISSSGTVTINARVVDLNGKIYSGLQNSDIVIAPDFKVLTANGKLISAKEARELYEQDHSMSIFKLEGFTGLSLVYDAEKNWISLNNYQTLTTGISITGNIVNSDPTGNAGLYIASGGRDINIKNNSAYTLNIGSVDLSLTACNGITLQNTYTGETTRYTQNVNGIWTQEVTKGATSSITELGTASSATYSGTSKYQVKLQKQTSTPMEESGRLTHSGDLKDAKPGDICNDGKVGTKETIIDSMTVNTKGTQVLGGLDYSYVAWDSKHDNGYASSSHTLTDKKLTNIYDPGTALRWRYTLKYDDVCTNELYISAANSVGIHFSGAGSSGSAFKVVSGNVNFSGVVTATNCTVEAVEAVTAGISSRVNASTVTMSTTKGSIGSGEQPLTFNADTAVFSAKQDLNLATGRDSGSMVLRAGNSLKLSSEASISGITFNAGGSAAITAHGSILTDGTSSAARTTLTSKTGGIKATNAGFAPGILTAEAEQDIFISTAGALALDEVESRRGNVTLNADRGITSVKNTDLSNLTIAPGSSTTSTSLQKLVEGTRAEFSDEYYAKLLHYEQLYYEKDEQGNYTHRDAKGTFILPEEQEARQELSANFKNLYESGKGDYLGKFIYALSGMKAVGGTVFANEADALTYLANHADKLETDFARAYYDLLVMKLTGEVRKLHGKELAIDYGQFNETVYRLYWLKDHTGKYVNQDKYGNFISPNQTDGFGNVIGKIYSNEVCKAITAQFRSQGNNGSYKFKESGLLGELAEAASGYSAASTMVNLLQTAPAMVAGGSLADNVPVTVRASGSISLTTKEDQSIGGNACLFSIKPVAWNEDGTPVYSDWAKALQSEIKHAQRAGVELISENKATGERIYAISYFEGKAGSINGLDVYLLQQAVPSDIHQEFGVCRVYIRNYIGVDAPTINASGRYVLITSKRDLTLSGESFNTNNLYLSTTGSINGSVKSDGGVISLYAQKGIGSADNFFGIAGSSTYSLGSEGDVYLKTSSPVELAYLSGELVTIDSREGTLSPHENGTIGPNIVGRRINFYGDLDTGLGFRTFGTSEAEGGLHWYGGGSSENLKYKAFNTAYKFWFKAENPPTSLDRVDVDYSGYLELVGLPETIQTAEFRQIGHGTSPSTLAIKGRHTFEESLAFNGEGSYTILSPELLTIGGGTPVNVCGDATFRIAGIETGNDSAIRIHGTGDLAFFGYEPDSTCEFMDDVSINGLGNVTLANVRIAGQAALTGKNLALSQISSTGDMQLDGLFGISGSEISGMRIRANSPRGGVFLNADTLDLSGSSMNAFVVDLESLGDNPSVTVHDINACGTGSKVIVRALSDELLLGSTISGAALEFYSTGTISRNEGAILHSHYPFWNIWQSNDSSIYDMKMDVLDSEVSLNYVWFVDDSYDNASQNSEDVQKLRRKVNGEEDIPTVPALRFMDKDGNTVSREQYSNLITNK